jgi:hypothetical protein
MDKGKLLLDPGLSAAPGGKRASNTRVSGLGRRSGFRREVHQTLHTAQYRRAKNLLETWRKVCAVILATARRFGH